MFIALQKRLCTKSLLSLKSPRSEDNALDKELVPEETMTQVPDNSELSIFNIYSGEMWERKKLVIDDIFCNVVATEISKGNDEIDDIEPRSINEC